MPHLEETKEEGKKQCESNPPVPPAAVSGTGDDEKPMQPAVASSGSTLKSMITEEITSEQIVYERLFAKSLPQQKRDSYFLTEMYNIKSLIRRQGALEDNIDLKLRAGLPDKTNAKQLLAPYYTPTSAADRTLVFESKFESGNLCMAIKISDYEYNLLMQNDINTQGHTQWFFFRVTNTKAGAVVRFNILNFVSRVCESPWDRRSRTRSITGG